MYSAPSGPPQAPDFQQPRATDDQQPMDIDAPYSQEQGHGGGALSTALVPSSNRDALSLILPEILNPSSTNTPGVEPNGLQVSTTARSKTPSSMATATPSMISEAPCDGTIMVRRGAVLAKAEPESVGGQAPDPNPNSPVGYFPPVTLGMSILPASHRPASSSSPAATYAARPVISTMDRTAVGTQTPVSNMIKVPTTCSRTDDTVTTQMEIDSESVRGQRCGQAWQSKEYQFVDLTVDDDGDEPMVGTTFLRIKGNGGTASSSPAEPSVHGPPVTQGRANQQPARRRFSPWPEVMDGRKTLLKKAGVPKESRARRGDVPKVIREDVASMRAITAGDERVAGHAGRIEELEKAIRATESDPRYHYVAELDPAQDFQGLVVRYLIRRGALLEEWGLELQAENRRLMRQTGEIRESEQRVHVRPMSSDRSGGEDDRSERAAVAALVSQIQSQRATAAGQTRGALGKRKRTDEEEDEALRVRLARLRE
ncbi:uncharacterized protein Z520_06095 [Fonsecaea multimorphosa CBS 102226]|uniref:Uncharacterized protein n=1 Tax=Fonsecaea multimorphosa CBS 102226 TaxID=1442371 RepID=A0A0D2ILZ1_9EURO|nr:uncharacterized protein Z520_06095 [Fonsecaea multimorphosa CBS 102226]KIX98016.1 hypothetical protein Z520_06095 [Fonsecaea multimorphosa CBS 102226]OAL24385.1 hypothetical protein AYO22_05761 [Fonsecaea multimorphosa]